MYSNAITTLYVSQKHGSANSCGYDRSAPTNSLQTALNTVADFRRFGLLQPITIEILDDIYFVNQTIEINGLYTVGTAIPRSPSLMSNITIKGHNTVVCGGKRIENWQWDEWNGVRCISAELPELRDGYWFTDLYVNDTRADVTYYPHGRLLRPKEVENNSSKLHASSKWFVAAEEDIEFLSRVHNLQDCTLSYRHYWIDEHTPIESYDLQSGKIEMKYRSRFTIEPTHPASALEYRLENVAECFQDENEWYLDRTSAKVYYIPHSDVQDISALEIYAPVVKTIFSVSGTAEEPIRGVVFENLIFSHTRGDYVSRGCAEDGSEILYGSDGQSVCRGNGTLQFTYAQDCAVRSCTVKNFGVHAIVVDKGCSDISIYGNTIFNGGAGGIRVNGGAVGSAASEHTHHIEIAQNRISALGRHYLAGCGVLLMHAHHCTVAHNDISDLYYTGISCGWVWGYADSISSNNHICKNHVHDIGKGMLSDMGGIYLLGEQRGTVVSGNVVHDVRSKHYGGWGIYTDEGSSYMRIENNICYDVTCDAYHQHYGCMNTVRNNIFIGGKDYVLKHSRNECHVGLLLECNIMVSTGGPIYRIGYGDGVSDSYHLLAGNRNLFWCADGTETRLFDAGNGGLSLEQAQTMHGMEYGSVIADPEFYDLAHADFRLRPTSPALALGFEPISTEDVGVTI